MLVLSRKIEETVNITFEGQSLEIKVLGVSRGQVRLGFTGPRDIKVARGPALTTTPATPVTTETT